MVRESIWRRNGSFLGTDAEIGTVQQVVKGHARRRRVHLTKRGEAVGWSVLWVAVAALVVLPYMHSYRHLSPFDEMVHLDYLVKVQDGHLVRGGELSGETAMREQACRGHDLKDFPGAAVQSQGAASRARSRSAVSTPPTPTRPSTTWSRPPARRSWTSCPASTTS